jgi:hypothetical protein
MAGEDARLTLGIDASGAVQGARQFVDATKTVEQGATRASGGVASMAKQFGLAKGQLKDFGQIGATVFAGDILAKALGFTNVMGAVGAATSLLAQGIRELATGMRDDFRPATLEAINVTERFLQRQKELSEALTKARGSFGSGIQLGPFDDRSRFFNTQGFSQGREAQLGEEIRRLNENYRRNLEGKGGYVGAEQQLRASEPQLRTLYEFLKRQQDAEDKRLATEKEIAKEMAKQSDEIRKQLQDVQSIRDSVVRGQGGPSLGVASYASPQARAAQEAGQANAQGQFREFQEMRRLAESVPGRIGPAIMSAFENSASIIARALTSGAPDPSMQYAAEGRNYIRSEEIKKATEEARQFRLEQERIAEEAKQFQNLQIGQMLASGFEEAIFSGQKLSEVLRQLALDLARMVFQQQVTSKIAGYIAGELPGGAPGSGQPFQGGNGPIQQPMQSSGGRNMSGGVGGGFRLSGPQRIENSRRGMYA